MLETPYWIAYALCRLPLHDPPSAKRCANWRRGSWPICR